MLDILPYAVTIIIASGVVILNFLNSEYQNTFFLLKGYWVTWAYFLMYGLSAVVIFVFYRHLIDSGTFQIEGPLISDIWVQAIVIGLVAKDILKQKIYTAKFGRRKFPIGLDTLVFGMEILFLRSIDRRHRYELREYLARFKNQYTNLDEVKQRVIDDLSEEGESETEKEVRGAKNIKTVFFLYLKDNGRRSFESLFPC